MRLSACEWKAHIPYEANYNARSTIPPPPYNNHHTHFLQLSSPLRKRKKMVHSPTGLKSTSNWPQAIDKCMCN